MPKRFADKNLIVGGAARFKDLLYVAIRQRNLVKEEVNHSRFIGYYRGEWLKAADKNWTSVAICVAKKPAEKVVAVSENGEVMTYVSQTITDEVIQPRPVVLRGMSVVEGYPIACGMNRQVYKRTAENSWVPMHAPAPEGDRPSGFEDIAGLRLDEIYAVGWNGEIWQWNGKAWRNRNSPTNVILTGLYCVADGQVYICGQEGTLIRGRNNSWDLIDTGEITADFWNVHWFNDTLYISTMSKLYQVRGTEVSAVDFGADAPQTCYWLTDADGVMWSLGSDDIFSFDGKKWTRIE
jgi:hypothetical protein